MRCWQRGLWPSYADGGRNDQGEASGFRFICFSAGSKPIILGMAGFHLTELKFSCDMKASTLRPLFEGILMKNSSIRSCFLKAVPHDAGVRVIFSSLNEEAVAETERMLNDVGNVRRMGVEEVTTVVRKDEQVKSKKQQQLNNLARQKDGVGLSRELLAMHGSEGKASTKRRFAQQLAKMNEKSERVASYGLREAAKRDDSSGEEENINS